MTLPELQYPKSPWLQPGETSHAFSPSISSSRAQLGTCGQEGQELIGDIGGEQGGDLPRIVGGKHLYHVQRDEA